MTPPSTSLAVGLLDVTAGWLSLLEGIGVPWRAVHTIGEPTPEEFGAIVVNRHLWSEEIEAIEAYVRAGGAVLDIDRFLRRIEPWSVRASWVRTIDRLDTLLDRPMPEAVDRRGRTRRYAPDDRPITIRPLGSGTIISLGFDPGVALLDTGRIAKRFGGIDDRHPAETVSRVDKGDLALLVEHSLQYLFAERDLPFVRKRRFPGDAPTVALFRIDTDRGSAAQIERLHAISKEHQLPFTWFIHTEGHDDLTPFTRFDLGEIALHCARHRTYPDRERNLENMKSARRTILDAGLPDPVGFAAPNGFWNHGLAEAIDEMRFLYSSEFTLAFDALPMRPILPITRRVNEHFYKTLQIPICPVSVGNLARVGYSEPEMIVWYRRAIERKDTLAMPRIFYHHPTHERYDVVDAIVTASLADGATPMTFTEYALWWQKREATRIDAELVRDASKKQNDPGTVILSSHERDPSVQIDILLPDRSEAIIWRDGPNAIADMTVRPPRPIPENAPATWRRWSATVARRAIRDWVNRRTGG